ncbi:ral guanine nucleotide dissociation stimulator-like [Thomomys bottae]
MVHIKGTVPYLKTFLGDFRMIDKAFRDFLDEGVIHFEKLRKEYAIMEQLKQLQASCSYEHITPEEKFLGWFRGLERLSEEASHQTQSAAISTSGSSQLKWMDQDKGGPEMSSTNTTAVQSDSNVQSAPSSSSYLELIRSISQTSSGDPKKVTSCLAHSPAFHCLRGKP